MKKHFYLLKTFLCVFAAGVLVGCSNDEDVAIVEGEGLVTLNLSTDAGFQAATKAPIDESPYADANNYKVEVLDASNETKVVKEWETFADVENPVTLPTGSYKLKAYYGEAYKSVAAGQAGFYVEGVSATAFNVESTGTATASVTCKPTSVKVAVEFDEKMEDYFDNYYMRFNTVALGADKYQELKNTDPLYLIVNENEVVKADIVLQKKGESSYDFIAKTYTFSPGEAKKIKVSPSASSGNFSLTIEIDDTVEEVPITIEIPSDWE